MARSASGWSHSPLKAAFTGSNPVRAANVYKVPWIRGFFLFRLCECYKNVQIILWGRKNLTSERWRCRPTPSSKQSHVLYISSEYPAGNWRDEFQGRYTASWKVPDLSDEERYRHTIDTNEGPQGGLILLDRLSGLRQLFRKQNRKGRISDF